MSTTWTPAQMRKRTIAEIWLVLGLSLGASAAYAIVALAQRLVASTSISDQTATINGSVTASPVFDLIYQVLGLTVELVPVALALYLLWTPTQNPFRRIGLDLREPGRDIRRGLALMVIIGIPGIALYLVGHALGITVTIVPSALGTYWWTVPVLLLSAARAALQEEVIVVGFLFTKLGELKWRPWTIILTSAVLRGSYHLYQGFGPFIGNAVMGVVFGWCYRRWGRVMPLIIAHFILDALSFVGYPLVTALFPGFLPVPHPTPTATPVHS